MTAKGCPHKDIRYCPLYAALHGGSTVAYGCDDGRLQEGGCAVSRGMDHDRALARLEARWPGLVAECRFREEAAEAKAQRLRNMKAAGLH